MINQILNTLKEMRVYYSSLVVVKGDEITVLDADCKCNIIVPAILELKDSKNYIQIPLHNFKKTELGFQLGDYFIEEF